MVASTGDVSCAVTVISFCVGLGKSPAEMMKLIRSSEAMNPCSVSSTSGMKDSGMEENQRRTDSRDGPPWVVKMTMKDINF